MSIPLHTTVTVSCDKSEQDSGPTIVHSSGTEGYRIHPRIIQLLQETFTNDNLQDDELGVRCNDPIEAVVDAFKSRGFSIMAVTNNGSRKLWVLTNSGAGGGAGDDGGNDQPGDEGDGGEEEEN